MTSQIAKDVFKIPSVTTILAQVAFDNNCTNILIKFCSLCSKNIDGLSPYGQLIFLCFRHCNERECYLNCIPLFI